MIKLNQKIFFALFLIFAIMIIAPIQFIGAQQNSVCTKQWEPVCGVDNKTYGNICMLEANGVKFASTGECIEKKFYSKGTITTEHFTGRYFNDKNFHGGVIWTAIKNDKMVMISQSEDIGRTKIQATLLPVINCEQAYTLCVMATVVDSDNTLASVGDKFVVKINPDNNKQMITGESGFLKDFEFVIDVTKIYKKQ